MQQPAKMGYYCSNKSCIWAWSQIIILAQSKSGAEIANRQIQIRYSKSSGRLAANRKAGVAFMYTRTRWLKKGVINLYRKVYFNPVIWKDLTKQMKLAMILQK